MRRGAINRPLRMVGCVMSILPFFALLVAHFFRGGNIASQKFVAESWVCTIYDRYAQLACESQHETDIVNTAQAKIELLFGPRQVMNIRRLVIATGVAVTAFIDGAACGAETSSFDIDAAIGCKEPAVPGNAGGQYAVEH